MPFGGYALSTTKRPHRSYAMIAPDGRFFDSATGQHRYSDPITSVGVSAAWRQIHFDPKLFKERTRNYRDSLGGIHQINAF